MYYIFLFFFSRIIRLIYKTNILYIILCINISDKYIIYIYNVYIYIHIYNSRNFKEISPKYHIFFVLYFLNKINRLLNLFK